MLSMRFAESEGGHQELVHGDVHESIRHHVVRRVDIRLSQCLGIKVMHCDAQVNFALIPEKTLALSVSLRAH